jgi:hypothetical protein
LSDFKAVIVDDNASDLTYADRLTRDGLDCLGIEPPKSSEDLRYEIDRLFKSGECDVLLLDYRLDAEKVSTGERRNYRGGSAAAEIRERIPDLPIVLVTTEPKFRANLRNKSDVMRLFDHTVLKSELASRHNRKRVVLELRDLASGYQSIRIDQTNGWKRITNALNDKGGPGWIEDIPTKLIPSGTSEIARFILEELLAFPGLLIDEAEACAILGITPTAFHRDDLQRELAHAKYDGVFSNWHPRWWRWRLQDWISSLSKSPTDTERPERARLISKRLKLTAGGLRSATCVWCGQTNVALTCSICRQAVDPTHGLRAVIDLRPSWCDPAFVCYECIQNAKDTDALFRPEAMQIVKAIRTGELSQNL